MAPNKKKPAVGRQQVEGRGGGSGDESAKPVDQIRFIKTKSLLKVLAEFERSLQDKECPRGRGKGCCNQVADALREWIICRYLGTDEPTPIVKEAVLNKPFGE